MTPPSACNNLLMRWTARPGQSDPAGGRKGQAAALAAVPAHEW